MWALGKWISDFVADRAAAVIAATNAHATAQQDRTMARIGDSDAAANAGVGAGVPVQGRLREILVNRRSARSTRRAAPPRRGARTPS